MPRMRLSPYSKDDQSEGYRRGFGQKISRLSKAHQLVLAVLNAEKADDFQHGIGLNEFFPKLRQFCIDSRNSVPFKGGASGRLSELSGLGLVKCETNEVELLDPETQHYRLRKPQGWFLTSKGVVGANRDLRNPDVGVVPAEN